MNVYLCGRTALDVYFLAKERLGLSFYSRLERVEVGSLEECAHTARQVAGCELGFLAPLHAGRIDVLVPSANLCNASAAVQPHVWSGELPAGAFAKVSDGVYLATPEFLALMMARTLDRYQTLQLCMQLCGIYANSRTAKHGMVQHPRLAIRMGDAPCDGRRGVARGGGGRAAACDAVAVGRICTAALRAQCPG